MREVPTSILDLIAAGRKIEAIKEVRALTGWGLREAKDAVEKIERGESVAISQPAAAVDPDDLAARIYDLVEDGQTIQAIKEVREATGANLRDAKQIVDRVARGDLAETPEALAAPGAQPTHASPSARLAVIAALIVALMGLLMAWLVAA